MNNQSDQDHLVQLENQLIALGRAFPFPPTPEITALVAARSSRRSQPARLKLATALLAVLVLAAGLLVVPPVRAAVLEYIQIGAIRVLFDGFFLNRTDLAAGREGGVASGTTISIENWQALAGELTFEEAMSRSGFPLDAQGFPPELGPPDRVFLQSIGGPLVLLIWTDPGGEAVSVSIMILGPGAFVGKGSPPVLEEITVRENPGIWVEGEHDILLLVGDPPKEELLRVAGNVLIWEESGLTYRVEANISLEDALRLAESLP